MKKQPTTKLHHWLRLNGMTDLAFATQIGCERSTVTKLRFGKITPSLPLAVKISDVTKINVRDLMVKEVAG